ncbi:MAG TPA: hypothetical protein VM008_06865 [Phycisphaerae bacterium]|nr:hypothetical protein [Phycisphaerae bacterium]
MATPIIMEELESRTLMSGTPTSPGPLMSAAVIADRAHIQADLLKFQSDCLNATATLLTDITAIKTDDPKQATTVTPLLQKMRADIHTMQVTLLGDRLTEKANVLADESVITSDLAKIVHDKGNPTAVAADRTQLRADRIKLQNDMIAGLNARITTRQTAYPGIVADGNAVVAAVQTDAHASPKLQADLSKWVTDRTGKISTLTADLQQLVADRTHLVTDLTAEQST